MSETMRSDDKQGVETRLLVTVEEAARMCSVSRSKMYELVAARAVPSIVVGRCRRVPLDALRRWIATQMADAAEAA